MFFYLLVALLGAASVHIASIRDRSVGRIGEIVLTWILVGYCGLPMLAVSVWTLGTPEQVAAALGFPSGNPFQEFLGFAYLAMSILAILALRYRGTYLIGPTVCWSVFFAGATVAHLRDYGARGGLTHHDVLAIFATHGLISLLLVGALIASGLLRARV